MFNKKAYLQISFAWLFAMIVGAFILFLAIYASVKLIGVGQAEIDAKTSKELGILLNPLETGFEDAKVSTLVVPVESRIFTDCRLGDHEFGLQLIRMSQQSFGKWTKTEIDVGFGNKYIFAPSPLEGKKFYVFLKPFEFPFKVTDLYYITESDQDYCFLGLEGSRELEDIKSELKGLGQPNILVNNCTREGIRVCFEGSSRDCDIDVNYERGRVSKPDGSVTFETDALMYAAIFSEKGTYECQVRRLMQRIGELSLIYIDKGAFVAQVGCSSNLEPEISLLHSSAEALDLSSELRLLRSTVDTLGSKNRNANCKMW